MTILYSNFYIAKNHCILNEYSYKGVMVQMCDLIIKNLKFSTG